MSINAKNLRRYKWRKEAAWTKVQVDYRYAYELVQRQGVCIDATVMTSSSLAGGLHLSRLPWSSHCSMSPGPCGGANPFSPNAKPPGPPEVTAAAISMFMLSIWASSVPPSGPFPFRNLGGRDVPKSQGRN